MHAPSWASRNLNIPTIVALVTLLFAVIGAIVTSVTNYNDMRFRIDTIETSRKEGREQWTDRMERIEGQLEAQRKLQENVPYRLTVVEQQIIAQNQRMDRAYESFMAALEVIRKDINAVGTKVEVLSQKIDGLAPPPRRTAIERRAEIVTSK